MPQLIAVQQNVIGSTSIQSVMAKELYLGLGLGKGDWARWYPTNIERNEFFSEHKDWEGFSIMLNGNETRDFAISIDFAKHVAMMSRTPKGNDYRNYFLELEKKVQYGLKQPMSQLDILAGQIQIMQEQERRLNQTEQDVKQLESKVETMQIDLRNGVPFGCISKKNAWNVYCPSLGYDTFKQVMEYFKVETQNYVHHAEGYSTPTFAYVESQIKTAINNFIEDLTQETKCFCHSNFLNKRVKYFKV